MKWKPEKSMIPVVVLVAGLAAGVAEGNLIALWDFDYGGASDRCGNNNGSFNGYPDWATGHGGEGLALKLSGSEYVSVDNESNFDITDEITVAVWIKVNAFDKQWQAIVTKGDHSWRLARNNRTSSVKFNCDGLQGQELGPRPGVVGNVDVNDGQWHHVAGVYDGSKICLYVDGALDASAKASGTINTDNFDVYIGENAEQPGRGFTGLLDDVAVFNQALNPEQISQLYRGGAASFVPKSYMTKLVEEAQAKIKDITPLEAVAFLEEKIADYEQWKVKNLGTIEPCDRRLSPDVLYLLAKAKEAAGLPKRDIVAAYKRSVSQVSYRTNYVPAAVLWLFENVPPEDYIDVVGQFVRSSSVLCHNLYNIAKHFESSENWDAFKLFLDGMLSTVDRRGQPTYFYTRVIARGLNEDGAWAHKFVEYCRNRPELTECLFYRPEQIAKKHVARQNFRKAAEIYRDIIRQCGPNQKKAPYEFKLCESLYNDGQYGNAVQELNSFVKNNKAAHRILVGKALMLKGQAYVRLGDIDRATDTFFDLLIEYPESELAAPANFFVGYCYMLQGKFDDATEGFNLVVRDYPESTYASEASLYLTRIKSMTD